MVATKRVPLAEVDNGKERRSGAGEGLRPFLEPLGGFIFVCNNETMGEDFDRHLFGLPQRYGESVKNIQPGLPLFLYNYSTHFLHGVFEASSDGGLNIEPEAWVENKDSRKNGRQSISRFPAQVRVRWREERPPLEEEKFRPLLFHYDGPRFRLQLSKTEAHELLKLFGASPVRKIEEVQEDTGGEWEKVKSKSKASRAFRVPLGKGSTSPNSTVGRRWGSSLNGSSNGSGTNGGVSLSSLNNSVHEAVSRGRDRENKVDGAQRWRTDSDSWSGSSSACTTSSNCGSHDEDRMKRLPRENGCVAEVSDGGQGHDGSNGASSKSFSHTNSSIDTDHADEIRLIEDDLNELNGFSDSNGVGPPVGASSYSRSGFVSYSAALKSGMLGVVATDNGHGENQVCTPAENGIAQNSTLVVRSNRNSYSSAAAAVSGSPLSPNGSVKGDLSVDRIEDGVKQKPEVVSNKVRSQGEGVFGNHAKVGPPLGAVENGKQEPKAERLSNGDGYTKKTERLPAWGKSLTARSNLQDIVNEHSTAGADHHKSVVKNTGDLSNSSKKIVKDGSKDLMAEGSNGDVNAALQRSGNSELKETPVKSVETVVRKNVWQGNDGAVLRLLHDPDPAVNSSPMNTGTMGRKVDSETHKKFEKGSSPSLPIKEPVTLSPVEKVEASQPQSSDGRQVQNPKQSSSSTGALPPHVSHQKAALQDAPFLQQNRVHDSRRQHFDYQKHEKNPEDRPHFRKQNGHSQEHSQHNTPSMMHTQQHQIGQGLMPLHIPNPPPGMQQHHHPHPILASGAQPLYRDRSRPRASNGSVENVHGLTYRPISRNIVDGDGPLQSPLGPGAWGMQSPVVLMQPMMSPVAGNLTFPTPAPHLLVNAEALHAEILEFAQAARPSAETRVHAEAAVECVRSSIRQLWPEADVEVFGSFATGLCLHHSDVDVVVVDAPPPPESPETAALSGARLLTPLIRTLSVALKESKCCEGLNTIETASMPVIKLRCNPFAERSSPGPSVAIDITIGGKRSESFAGVSQLGLRHEAVESKPVNPRFEAARNAHNGAAAREFVIERLRQLPALAPLVLLLKSFLRHKGLNDVYSGGLGSFALTLMLVFYLERVAISCGIPQEAPQASNSQIPQSSNSQSLVNPEASALSVDTSQSSLATAESVDFSDDDSSDSSVLTSTSASSMGSLEVASVQESSAGGNNVSTTAGLSDEEPLLRKAGGIVEELLASMHSVASPNLGTLLVGFLHFFGQEIDFSRVRLVLKGKDGSAGGVFWHEKNARTLPLWIDDPLRPDANIGAGSFNIWQVQAAMREMLSLITKPQPAASNSLPDGQRVGKGPGRRRQLPLLQQFLVNDLFP